MNFLKPSFLKKIAKMGTPTSFLGGALIKVPQTPT